MTAPHSPERADEIADSSIGELIGNISNDLSQLFRQEVELAKAEVKEEAAKAGKAAGMLGGAGFAGYLAVVLLSFALVFGLANVMDAGWAALIVARDSVSIFKPRATWRSCACRSCHSRMRR